MQICVYILGISFAKAVLSAFSVEKVRQLKKYTTLLVVSNIRYDPWCVPLVCLMLLVGAIAVVGATLVFILGIGVGGNSCLKNCATAVMETSARWWAEPLNQDPTSLSPLAPAATSLKF